MRNKQSASPAMVRGVKIEKTLVSMDDGKEMGLVYALPPSPSKDTICLIIAHGAGGSMYSPFITYFHTELAKKGFLTVKFNFPYMEARKRVPDKREVLEEAYRRIIETVKTSDYHPSHLFIGGKSMGGRIASQVAAEGVDADGLFFLGYPLHPPGNLDRLRDEHLFRISKPMLFVSGTRDAFATKSLLEKTFAKLGTKARVYWVENGDHSLNNGQGKEALSETYVEVVGVLSGWVEHCLRS